MDDQTKRPYAALGQMLKDGRKASGWTQQHMAVLLDVSHTYVAHIEAGRMVPSERALRQWTIHCGLNGDDMCFAAGKVPPDLEERLTTDRSFLRRVRGLI